MHLEIQIALNFVISYLYNKLPRRRVNLFGEELEKALREQFQGHWYPKQPTKGSAFRCLKTGDAVDSVLHRAARESGVSISDILENLPEELSIWIDPGEVSYRTGEKSVVRILYSENIEDNNVDSRSADNEVNTTFHSIAHDYHSVCEIGESVLNLYLSPTTSPVVGSSSPSSSSSFKSSPNPTTSNSTFMQRSNAPLTFTTATFAQTKFGSTKLKTNGKRSNSNCRLSPTEFSNFLKQRTVLHHNFYHLPESQISSAAKASALDSIQEPSSNFASLSHVAFSTNQNAEPIYFQGVGIGVSPKIYNHFNPFKSSFQQETTHLASGNSIDFIHTRSSDIDSLKKFAYYDAVLHEKNILDEPKSQSKSEAENDTYDESKKQNEDESTFGNSYQLPAIVSLGRTKSETLHTAPNPKKIDSLKLFPSGNESYSHVVVAN